MCPNLSLSLRPPGREETSRRTCVGVVLSAVLASGLGGVPEIGAQEETGPRFELKLRSQETGLPCGGPIEADARGLWDDRTGGVDFFFDELLFQTRFEEVPNDRPGHTFDVILRTTDNPTSDMGAQGWSWGLATEGIVSIVDVTTNGSRSCLGGRFPRSPMCLQLGGFESVELTGPDLTLPDGTVIGRSGPDRIDSDGDGTPDMDNTGAVSAVVLASRLPVTLPPDEEESIIAKVRVLGILPDTGETEGRLFWAKLQGSGQGVPILVTFGSAVFGREGDPRLRLTDCELAFDPSRGDGELTRGDPDGDGRVTVTDVVLTVRMILGIVPLRSGCDDALDLNDDGSLDLSDAVRLLLYRRRAASPRRSSTRPPGRRSGRSRSPARSSS